MIRCAKFDNAPRTAYYGAMEQIALEKYLEERFNHIASQLDEIKANVKETRGLYDGIITRYNERIIDIEHKVLSALENCATNKAAYKALSEKVEAMGRSKYEKIERWLDIVLKIIVAAVVAWALTKLSGGAL